MSFNNLRYDTCSYKQVLSESIGPGEYQLGKPQVNCEDCFTKDPQIIQQRSGVSVAKNLPIIDVDSELMNLTRKASGCSSKNFIPKFNAAGEIDNSMESINFNDCNRMTTESTRLSNPTSTLRGTGWNRWEWLCEDPQKKSLVPFDYQINNNIVIRDNHRPLIPKPMDQTALLPTPNEDPIKIELAPAPAVPLGAAQVYFNNSNNIRNL